jgi:predicted transcriptional regulator
MKQKLDFEKTLKEINILNEILSIEKAKSFNFAGVSDLPENLFTKIIEGDEEKYKKEINYTNSIFEFDKSTSLKGRSPRYRTDISGYYPINEIQLAPCQMPG